MGLRGREERRKDMGGGSPHFGAGQNAEYQRKVYQTTLERLRSNVSWRYRHRSVGSTRRKIHLSQLFVTIYTLSSTVVKDEYSTIEEIPDFSYPVAEAQIPKGSTVAVISRLASHEFTVTNKGCSWDHPDYDNLSIVIPKKTISARDKMNVHVKVACGFGS